MRRSAGPRAGAGIGATYRSSPGLRVPERRTAGARQARRRPASPTASDVGETPSITANATTMAAPRSRYRMPTTISRLSAAAFSPASSGVIQTITAATTAHTHPSANRKSRNGASGVPSGRGVTRWCHCQASPNPASAWSTNRAGTVSPRKRTVDSKTAYASGRSGNQSAERLARLPRGLPLEDVHRRGAENRPREQECRYRAR